MTFAGETSEVLFLVVLCLCSVYEAKKRKTLCNLQKNSVTYWKKEEKGVCLNVWALVIENTFYIENIFFWEHILNRENTFYIERTHYM